MSHKSSVDVSIIMPVYNHEKYVAKALESIFDQQTSFTYEVIIGEDCSPDNSRAIIKDFEARYPDRIKAYYREKNLGATNNGYLLHMEAKGRYIAILEGDDYWCDRNKIQRQAEFLDEHPEYIGVAHNFCKVDGDGNTIVDKCIRDGETNRIFTWEDFLDKFFLFQSATLMYRNFFLDGGDYSVLYKSHDIVGDLTVLTILLNRSNIYILPEVMSAYREVIQKKATNARSVSLRDEALSNLKTVRQLDMLRPYLKNKKDFNKRIVRKKTGFVIEFMRHKKGYTFSRLMKIIRYGDAETNFECIGLAINMFVNKIRKKDNLYV